MTSYRIKYSMIVEYVRDELPLIKRAENKLESDHVLYLEFDGSLGVLKGLVKASMKNEKHKIDIHMDDKGGISSSTCTCKRGQHPVCSHRVALLLHGLKNISPTDSACSWRAPSSSKSTTTTSIKIIYPSRKYDPTSEALRDEDKLWFKDQLKNLNRFTGFYWLLQDAPSINEPIPWHTVKDVLSTNASKESILNALLLTDEEIVNIAERTKGQRDNPCWFEMKFGRLTASNFGAIIAAINNNRFPPSLYSKLLGSLNLEGVKSIQYGINHEDEAIKTLEKYAKIKVEKTGIWLDKYGQLGASPDGLVGDNAIVEAKCPFKYKATQNPRDLIDDKDYCFHGDYLKKNHPYYHQIQGQLHILKRDFCYFVVWTPQFALTVKVVKDPEWEENLTKLRNFFVNNFLPKLME